MTSSSSYQPFLIGDGTYKTGFFSYLESWVKPVDAFDTLEDAYIYRGTIQKRQGTSLYPAKDGAGSIVYADSSKVGAIAAGAVTTRNQSSSGSVTIPILPIIAGLTFFYANTSAGVEKWTDNGLGVLTGSLGDTGTINYVNGNWSLTLGGGRTFVNPTDIWATYAYSVKYITTGGPLSRPIMGIKQFINETTNSRTLVVLDTRRASIYNSSTLVFLPLNTFFEVLGFGDGVSNPQLFTANWTSLALSSQIVPFTVTISDGVNSITDLGNGTFTTAGNMVGPNTIVYTTGAISLGLTAANTRTYTISATISGDYFTGNNTNFFNATNWKPAPDAKGYLYLTNNVDRVTTFDGNVLSRLSYFVFATSLDTNHNDVATTLDVKVYKNSLLFLRPTIVGASPPRAQTILSSRPFIPQDMVSDLAGHGAATVAPTGDWIFSSQFLRDAIVVFFQESTWLFRFTQNTNEPFRFDKINDSRNTNAPYGSVGYDLQCTSLGSKGLIYCDGNNVDRYDITIIDQFLDIEPKAFGQCFSQRFDSLNQTWTLFPSIGDAAAGNVQLTSSRVLIWNYLENTWAIYRLPMSCLGLGLTTTDLTWADFAPGQPFIGAGSTWEEWDEPWNSYQNIAEQPALLGGDQRGFVYELNVTNKDNGQPIIPNIQTKRMNPFLAETAMKATFGYLDVYYEVADHVTLTFNFSLNNSSDYQKSVDMQLTGHEFNSFAWQRIYLSMVGEFLQINITDNGVSYFKILGMILHAKPAGRLTPGLFL